MFGFDRRELWAGILHAPVQIGDFVLAIARVTGTKATT
jgi:hypothetical protein